VVNSIVESSPVSAEAILDDMKALVAVLSLDGTILYVNGEVLRRSSERSERFVGRPFASAPWWTHVQGISNQIDAALGDAVRGGKPVIDIETQLSPTQRIVLEFEIRPVRDPAGRIAALSRRDATSPRSERRSASSGTPSSAGAPSPSSPWTGSTGSIPPATSSTSAQPASASLDTPPTSSCRAASP